MQTNSVKRGPALRRVFSTIVPFALVSFFLPVIRFEHKRPISKNFPGIASRDGERDIFKVVPYHAVQENVPSDCISSTDTQI